VGRFWEHSVNNVLWLIVTQSYTVPWQRRKKVQSQLNIEHVNKSNRRFSGKICDCWNKLHFRGEWCVLHARIGLHFACFLSPIVICYCCLNRRLALEFAARTVLTMGSLNLQGMEFARKGGGVENCKEKKIQGKAPKLASVWICKDWNLQRNQQLQFSFPANSVLSFFCKFYFLQSEATPQNTIEARALLTRKSVLFQFFYSMSLSKSCVRKMSRFLVQFACYVPIWFG